MNQQIEILHANESDLEQILEIMNYEILNETSIYEDTPRTQEYIKEWYKIKVSDNSPVIVAKSNNTVLGFATYGKFRPRTGYRYTIEHSVYVHKKTQAKGVGKLLMSELTTKARTSGYKNMIARIDASNKGSIKFHKKMGFSEAGTLKKVGFKFDKWLDVVYMQLDLSQ